MTEQKHYPWQDGLPTAPDVQLLMETWPSMNIGDRIDYSKVAEVLKIEIGSNRWKSITDQWRKRLRERGLVVECEAGNAFYVASANQISAATYGVLKTIGKRAKRHRGKLAVARPENEIQKQTIEHQARLMQAVERDAKKSRMNLLPSTAAKETPKISPPKRA